MRKFFKYLFSFLLAIPMVFALTACGPSGDPGGDDGEKNPEFANFSTQAVAVMSAVDMSAEDIGGGVNLAPRRNELRLMPKTEIENVFNMFKTHAEAESVEDVNEEYSSCLETCFTFPLGFGDVITNKQGATNFYGVKARIDLSSAFDGVPTYASCIVENSGNITELFLFDPTPGVGFEKYSYMKLTYSSKANYNFEFIDYTQDLKNFIYAYGDSNQNFINLQKYTEGTNSSYGGYVSNGISCYYVGGVQDDKIQPYTESLIISKNPSQYNDKINSTKTGASYTVSIADVDEAFEKYVGKSNEEDEMYPIFVNKQGVVQSLYVGEDFDLETVVIPAKASALSAEGLTLNTTCNKVIIPDSVTSIKTLKSIVYSWETGLEFPEDDPTGNDYVDAPLECVLETFWLCAGPNWESMHSVEPVFSENNELFKTGSDGNVYLTYEGEEYLVYIKNWDVEILETLGGINTVATNDFRQRPTRKISYLTKNAIKQIESSEHKFKEIILDDSDFREFLTTDDNSNVGEYVVDKVTCFGDFRAWTFYRTQGVGGYGHEEDIYVPNTQKVTRIKELVIMPGIVFEYKYDLSDPQAQAPDWPELKAYIDQNYPGVDYDEVLDKEILMYPRYSYDVSIYVNRLIQIDKITIDPSIERLNLTGYVGENTVLNVAEDTFVSYFDAEIYGPVDVYIDDITQQSDFEYKISPFKGKINFITNYTQSEFDYFNQKASDWEGDLVRKHIKDLTQNNSSKYSLTYAEEDINILGFENSDLTPYFDYSQLNDCAFRYTASFGDFGYNQECQLYLNNMIDEIDFTKYILSGNGWDYKVYIQTYDEDEQQNVWVENADGKTLKNLMFDGWTKTINCKFVATKAQTSETKEKYLAINIKGQINWGSCAYDTEFFTELTQYTTDTVLEIKDGSGNVIADHSKLPLEYGENVFVLKCQFGSNVSSYQVKIVRQYNNRPVEYSKTEVNVNEYFSYYYLESYGFEVKIYDRAGVEVADRAKIALNVGDNIFRVVFTWKGEGEIPSGYENYDGRVEMINFIRAAE